jgi:hypothetical protein
MAQLMGQRLPGGTREFNYRLGHHVPSSFGILRRVEPRTSELRCLKTKWTEKTNSYFGE